MLWPRPLDPDTQYRESDGAVHVPPSLRPELRHTELINNRADPRAVPPWSWSWSWFCSVPHRSADMSACELPSLEECLETHLPEAELGHVRRILFGKETT